MKALGIAFSARRRGHCLNCIEYVLEELEQQGFQTEVVKAYDCEIRPCSHCNYECFARELRGKTEECPVQDDTLGIYTKMEKADIIVLAVPTYGGRPASLYCAFKERAQRFITQNYKEFQSSILEKIMALIVIGNVPAGGDLAYHTVVLDHYEWKYPPTSLLLQPREYNQRSINGTLMEDGRVRNRLDGFAELILERWRSRP